MPSPPLSPPRQDALEADDPPPTAPDPKAVLQGLRHIGSRFRDPVVTPLATSSGASRQGSLAPSGPAPGFLRKYKAAATAVAAALVPHTSLLGHKVEALRKAAEDSIMRVGKAVIFSYSHWLFEPH